MRKQSVLQKYMYEPSVVPVLQSTSSWMGWTSIVWHDCPLAQKSNAEEKTWDSFLSFFVYQKKLNPS